MKLPQILPLRSAAVLLCMGCTAVTSLHAEHSMARQWNEQLLAAIRRDVPNPPGHARNLHHVATAIYNCWAAYDPTAIGYIYNEKVANRPTDPQSILAARNEAISYAAYRVIRTRFQASAGVAATQASLNQLLTANGYSTTIALGPTTTAATPAELGKRVADAILSWGGSDGFSRTTFPQTYNFAVNPNMLYPLSVLGTNVNFQSNMPLGYGIPANTNPNFWQPLDMATSFSQNGLPLPGGTQTFVGVQSLATTAFSLTRTDGTKPWLDPFGGPSKLSVPGSPSASDAIYRNGALDVVRASSQLNDPTKVDISPGAIGNSPLGTDDGRGFATNPITHERYAPNLVKNGDFTRVLAEFWADGPDSETPPGHWHVLANEIADDPELVKKIRGVGPVVDKLEWDVKTYFSLAGAVHDAACAAWALKRYYSGTRPITMIRYLGTRGQSSDPLAASYHPQGLPLETGVAELITEASSDVGGKHETIFDLRTNSSQPGWLYVGQVAVYSWPGEHPLNAAPPAIAANQNHVRWMLAKDWLPFQRKTFNTPAFPGYISGHSTFSRAAAEVLTIITGSPYFPGGFHHFTKKANTLTIDRGPSEDVDLQWASYYDAADQAGQSRRFGGIHVSEDDYHGRVVGSMAGQSAYVQAEKYWTGEILQETIQPAITMLPNSIQITWNATRGMYHKVQVCTSLESSDWTDVTTSTIAYASLGTWTDISPDPGRKFYRVVRSTSR